MFIASSLSSRESGGSGVVSALLVKEKGDDYMITTEDTSRADPFRLPNVML